MEAYTSASPVSRESEVDMFKDPPFIVSRRLLGSRGVNSLGWPAYALAIYAKELQDQERVVS